MADDMTGAMAGAKAGAVNPADAPDPSRKSTATPPAPPGSGGAVNEGQCSRCGAADGQPCKDRQGRELSTPHARRGRQSMTFNDRVRARAWSEDAHQQAPEFPAAFLAWGFVTLRRREFPGVTPSLAEVRAWCERKQRELDAEERATA